MPSAGRGLSVIIPIYNEAEAVQGVLESLLAGLKQVPGESEIIVVDDGSTDHTAAFVAARFPEVRLLQRSGLGPGLARNAGVAEACGEVVMFLDSDDVWLPGHVSDLVRTMARGYPVAYGVTKNYDQLGGGEFCVPEPDMAVEGHCLAALASWCFLVPSAMAVETGAFVEAGGFGGGELGEDWSFFIRLAHRFPFGFCGEEPITLRYLHQGSLCNYASSARLEVLLASVSLALAETGAATEDRIRFQALADWTRQQGDWQTVQQWYISLKQEELI